MVLVKAERTLTGSAPETSEWMTDLAWPLSAQEGQTQPQVNKPSKRVITMPLTIAVPLDGSGFAEQAIDPALQMCSAGSQLHLLTVIQETNWVPSSWLDQTRDRVNQYLSGLVARLPHDLDVRSHVLYGDPSDEVLAFSAIHQPDLVVLASHGRGKLGAHWLGSTADRIMRGSQAPVLLVHCCEDSEPSLLPAKPAQRILIPVDESGLNASVGSGIVGLFGPDVDATLMRVIGDPHTLPLMMLDAVVADADLLKAVIDPVEVELQAEAAHAKTLGLRSVQTKVEPVGHPARTIMDFAQKHRFDLIALPRASTRRHRLFGKVTDKLLRGSTTPVLLFPTDPKASTEHEDDRPSSARLAS